MRTFAFYMIELSHLFFPDGPIAKLTKLVYEHWQAGDNPPWLPDAERLLGIPISSLPDEGVLEGIRNDLVNVIRRIESEGPPPARLP